MSGRILAFGASGKFAGMVVPALTVRGMTVRGFAKDAADEAKARENGASDIAIGDLNDRASIDRALVGIERVTRRSRRSCDVAVPSGRRHHHQSRARGRLKRFLRWSR